MVIKHWLHSAVICFFLPSFPPLSLSLSKPALRFQLFMDLRKAHNGERKQIRLQESRFIRVSWVNQQLDQSQTIRLGRPWYLDASLPFQASTVAATITPARRHHVLVAAMARGWKEEKESNSTLQLQISFNELKKKSIWPVSSSLNVKLLRFCS